MLYTLPQRHAIVDELWDLTHQLGLPSPTTVSVPTHQLEAKLPELRERVEKLQQLQH